MKNRRAELIFTLWSIAIFLLGFVVGATTTIELGNGKI